MTDQCYNNKLAQCPGKFSIEYFFNIHYCYHYHYYAKKYNYIIYTKKDVYKRQEIERIAGVLYEA